MQIKTFDIPGLVLLIPRVFDDPRGYFKETYNADAFQAATGERPDFVQDNHSLSVQAGTVRGLHYQAPPFAQGKLVRVVAGHVTDIAVDVRKGSATYGQHVQVHLSAENHAMLWVPAGFLHGFATLSPHTEFVYKVTAPYDKDCDGSVAWNDPALNIEWGLGKLTPIVSEKDKNAQSFADFVTPF